VNQPAAVPMIVMTRHQGAKRYLHQLERGEHAAPAAGEVARTGSLQQIYELKARL
jgi:hypothetical protein